MMLWFVFICGSGIQWTNSVRGLLESFFKTTELIIAKLRGTDHLEQRFVMLTAH